MSTHKHIDRVCLAAALLSLLLTLFLINGTALQPASRVMGYESRLFDTGRVHTLDIVMDGWETFLETCEDEAYSACSVVIDNEAYKNVGLRAKGNTSLSMVSAMDSSRYSFKLEFDHYEEGKTYHGLDKLCLNNLIQDNTFMKDYLTYRMMDAFGVDAPLCSYVFVTVNGEDWGLYLAVEGVEDGFLQRNYGDRPGSLYKPDSMNFGGGRGNGRNFDMDAFSPGEETSGGFPGGDFSGEAPPEGVPGGDFSGEAPPEGGFPGGDFSGGAPPEGGFPGGDFSGEAPPEGGFPGGGFPGGSSGDVKLQYSDSDPDSYPNLFSSAKTNVTEEDQARLIQALKILSEGTDIDRAVDIDKTLRYFVVHNYVVNGDSYTGSMVHNYYLHEKDGLLSMIPWDYNLAFGTFQASGASEAVNDPIDSPLSVTGSGDRPMADWIFSSEAYTALYHQYFQEFLESVDPAALIEEARALIAPYVERDPTKFCASSEFETGVEALKTFCALRTKSVSAQLEGTIPSTGEGQAANSAALVDPAGLTLSDMGTMNMGAQGRSPQGGRRSAESRPLSSRRSQPDSAGPNGPPQPEDPVSPEAVPKSGRLLLLSLPVLCAGLLIALRYGRKARP